MSDQPEQLRISLGDGPAQQTSKPKTAKTADEAEARKAQSANHISSTQARQPKSPQPSDGANTMPESTTKSADFETMLAELEKVVGQLEGELKLEEALALFERGLGLSQDCEKLLKAAQQKIEVLKRTGSGITTEPFAEESEPVV
ncbi:MAG TPA: exodeoxyribonuclease VII small subunit [Candidatus Obscuribacterales bacterium]